jgi:hypothetical protein
VNDQIEAVDNRSAKHRSRVMLAATVFVQGLAVGVRIRNISETGALLEGDVLPEVGASVILERNSLTVGATVVWSRFGRCGVKFAQGVVVSAWIGTGGSGSSPSGHHDADSGRPPLPATLLPLRPSGEELEERLPARVGEELAYLQRLVESVGNDLVANPLILHRHAMAFQNFDIIKQTLGHLADVLTADERVRTAQRIGMKELKARLLR